MTLFSKSVLGGRHLKLDERDFRVFHPGRSACAFRSPLIQDQALNHLRIVNRAAQLPHHFDVFQVQKRGPCGVYDFEQALHRHGRQEGGVL